MPILGGHRVSEGRALERAIVEIFQTLDVDAPEHRWLTLNQFAEAWDQIVGCEFPGPMYHALYRMWWEGLIEARTHDDRIMAFTLTPSCYLQNRPDVPTGRGPGP